MYKYIVVAKSLDQVKIFATRNGLKRHEVLYASRRQVLLGMNNLTVIFLRGWWEQKNHTEIYKAIMMVRKGYGIKILRMNVDGILTDRDKEWEQKRFFAAIREGDK